MSVSEWATILTPAATSILGILISSRMTTYRLAQLEKKVEKHNNLVEKVALHDEKLAVHNEKFKVANHRIEDLEEAARNGT
jgi:uncharacterized protein YcaQ